MPVRAKLQKVALTRLLGLDRTTEPGAVIDFLIRRGITVWSSMVSHSVFQRLLRNSSTSNLGDQYIDHWIWKEVIDSKFVVQPNSRSCCLRENGHVVISSDGPTTVLGKAEWFKQRDRERRRAVVKDRSFHSGDTFFAEMIMDNARLLRFGQCRVAEWHMTGMIAKHSFGRILPITVCGALLTDLRDECILIMQSMSVLRRHLRSHSLLNDPQRFLDNEMLHYLWPVRGALLNRWAVAIRNRHSSKHRRSFRTGDSFRKARPVAVVIRLLCMQR